MEFIAVSVQLKKHVRYQTHTTQDLRHLNRTIQNTVS